MHTNQVCIQAKTESEYPFPEMCFFYEITHSILKISGPASMSSFLGNTVA